MNASRIALLTLAAGALVAVAACSDDDETGGQLTSGVGASGGGGSGGSGGAGTGGMPPDRFIEGDVRAYEYAFDMDTGAASSRVTVDVTAAGNCYAIPSDLDVTAVKHDGADAFGVERIAGQLSSCGSQLGVGDQLVLSTQQQVPEQTFLGLDVGFSRTQNLAGGSFSYLLSWVGGCDHFGPCDDDPARFADFRFDVTHAPGATVLCPGAITAGTTTTSCQLSSSPTYSSFAIASDPQWQRSVFTSAAGVELVFYEVPGGQLQASLDEARVIAFMDWITTLLGPYPYGNELRIAGGPTAWLGFEHPGNIILRENLGTLNTAYADSMMHVFMHEVVHQWAGDRTTLAAVADFVWKEATAEYLSYVFEDTQGGPGEGDATRLLWDDSARFATYHPRPTEQPTPSLEQFYGDVYGPGPMTLYLQLEDLVGRAAVLQAIQSFLAEPAIASVDDLKGALEAATGEDLTAYFDAWVFGAGPPSWPTMTAATGANGNQLTVTVTQQNGATFGCAVEVDVVGANNTVTALVDFGLAPTSSSAQTVITFNEAVVSTVIDPRNRVINLSMGVQAERKTKPVWLY